MSFERNSADTTRCHRDGQSNDETTMKNVWIAASPVAAALLIAAVPAHAWVYIKQRDELTGAPARFAVAASLNELELGFPYDGAQRAKFSIGTHPRVGRTAMLSVERGQIVCSGECTISVRFDTGGVVQWPASEAGDGVTDTIVLQDVRNLYPLLARAKTMSVEASFFGDGPKTLTFDVADYDEKKLQAAAYQ